MSQARTGLALYYASQKQGGHTQMAGDQASLGRRDVSQESRLVCYIGAKCQSDTQ
jgi:uncharacterized protein YhbP (UPF0306 family)